MQSEGNVTLTIHGLAADNGLVRADVFLEKFRALLGEISRAFKQPQSCRQISEWEEVS
jgi:hypothetical protein